MGNTCIRFFVVLLSAIIGLTELPGQQFRALLVIETDGWHHPSILAGVPAMEGLAKRHDFRLDLQQEGMPVTRESLDRYEVVIFLNTTKDIFNDQEQAAFEGYIQSGKGYVGIHAAADTEYDWPWYNQLVGRMFVIHPHVQTAMIDLVEPAFPGLERWPKRLLWTDEWYEYSEEKVAGLQYLLAVDEATFDPRADWGRVSGTGMGDFHPIAWYHDFDGGRAFYTGLGHLPEVFTEKLFLEHVYGGIYWAATGKGSPEKKRP